MSSSPIEPNTRDFVSAHHPAGAWNAPYINLAELAHGRAPLYDGPIPAMLTPEDVLERLYDIDENGDLIVQAAFEAAVDAGAEVDSDLESDSDMETAVDSEEGATDVEEEEEEEEEEEAEEEVDMDTDTAVGADSDTEVASDDDTEVEVDGEIDMEAAGAGHR